MNSSTEDFHQFVINDLLAEFGDRLRSHKMFGGVGYYLDDRIFALLASSGELYYKVGDNNQADFEAAGSQPFVYTGNATKGPTHMPYWLLPAEIMDDPAAAMSWAEKAAENSQSKPR